MAILSGGGVLQFITTTYGKFFTVSFPFSSTLTAIFARLRCEIEFVFLVSGGKRCAKMGEEVRCAP